jgi:hypothetical protein
MMFEVLVAKMGFVGLRCPWWRKNRLNSLSEGDGGKLNS